ncbi:arylsulfatase [Arenibacter palladensis]|uniref:Arylsulfatase n=1 Tax=Arenibacter palladensis TaxID=237373 RepID=A0A1M5BFF3_9FLAO|nr:arylsulfatase [Arenibacter palladensis]SHF41178.1 arylsulfatase [Arenibacter palladensis]
MNLKYLPCIFFLLILGFTTIGYAQKNQSPNVILIITDDQGYGDLGFTGNPHVKTPVIDALARESVRFNNFYVSPVCAPTRSSLMTGRYSLRTGMRDTYNGGAIMASNEVTIAEMLKQANYSTGAFGKWHLGDNYPSRPSDQGFDESVIHLSGGMGQVGDITTYFKGDRSYFDPVLWHNNEQESFEGYCSDIFTDQAINFIDKNKESPFFCYLAFNAPHTPLQVPDSYYQKYKDIDPSDGFGKDGKPFSKMSEKDKEDARKVYAMVNNIDDNLGKLFKKLEDLKLTENTLVIFMTDNGPQQTRYVGGMRGLKGDVFNGGVRVPFYLKYPALYKGNKDVETMSAHLDVLPTLSEICEVEMPKDRIIDGKSLVPLIEGRQVEWEDRSLFFYWSRRYPELYNNMAIQKAGYKLVGKTDYDAAIEDFELFYLKKDPYEQRNLVNENKALAMDLKMEMDNIYNELILSENLVHPPRIMVGTPNENPVILNRNDAGGERGIWNQEEIYGNWDVSVEEGYYDINFKFVEPVKAFGKMVLEANTLVRQMENKKANTDIIHMKRVYFPKMTGLLIPFYAVDNKNIFPFWMEMKKVD